MEYKTEIYPIFPIFTGYIFNQISDITNQMANPIMFVKY